MSLPTKFVGANTQLKLMDWGRGRDQRAIATASPMTPRVAISIQSSFDGRPASLVAGAGFQKPVLVIEDGQGVELSKTAARVLQRFPVGRVLVDGKGVGDVGAVVLRDRQLLAQDGMVVVAVTVDRGTGEIIAGPEIASRGWVYERESETVLAEARAALREALGAGEREEPMTREALVALLRGTLRRFISQRYERKPIVLPIILEA